MVADKTATGLAGTRVEGAALASDRSVGLGSTSHCWKEREMRALLCTLLAWSAWVQPATVVAGTIAWPLCARSGRAQPASVLVDTTGEGAVMASVRMVGVDKPATVVACTTGKGAQLAFVRSVGMGSAGTIREGTALAFLRSVGVGSKRHCSGGHDS